MKWAMVGVLVLAMAGCTQASVVEVDEAHNGRVITLSPGQSLVVALESNPSTGFGWYLAEEIGPVLAMEGEPEFVSASGAELAGAPGEERLHFVAGRPGTVTLKLTYGRPWETTLPAAKHYALQVTVE
ncbi:protease inhibitor I42 family protein [Ferrimonas balearica]|uniref:protease inhibitor I42 family protein n=1 Tax=Ferrimonas balearica TaxID=44012 RepID=UPI001C99608C|nr:protease inhibitor I42 family protein [Ferrimonas balearica]MBY5990935.1 protease inhibitor I42 family protein [Ferrimonas balearica]